MATRGRKPKDGFEYFRHDVWAMQDVKLSKVFRKHGPLGYWVYFELLSIVYRDKGYCLEYNEDVADYLADLSRTESSKISEVVETIVSSGLFDDKIFRQHKILTSSRIQRQCGIANKELNRVSREIPSHLNLLDSDKNEFPRIKSEENGITSDLIPGNGNFPGFPRIKSDKGKEKKGKEIKLSTPPNNSLSYNTSTRGGNFDNLKKSSFPSEEPETEKQDNLKNSHSLPENPSENPETEQEDESETDASDSTALERSLTRGNPSHSVIYQDDLTDDSRGNFGDFTGYAENPENAPVQKVISIWNQVMQGTPYIWDGFYPSMAMDMNIKKEISKKTAPETFRKVFAYARQESEGNGLNKHQFTWTLDAVFAKEGNFARLRAKAETPDMSHKPQRGAPVASREDYLKYAFK